MTHEIRETPFQEFWRIFRKNKLAVLGMWMVFIFIGIAAIGAGLTWGQKPVFNPQTVRLVDKFKKPLARVSPDLMQLEPEARPRFGIYLLGTDEFGRDVFARMLEGAKVSLKVGFLAVSISILIGIILGAVAGFFGQKSIADKIVVLLVDVMLCFPSLFLILTIVAIRRPSIANIMIVIGLTSWMGTCRFVRAEFLSLRELDFVAAAKALGVPSWRIMFVHMLPNALSPVLVSANLGIAGAILVESSLSYLGFGVPPPNATWGNILADGKNYLFDAPHLTFVPGIAIVLTVLAFNLFGEGLRETINPKLRR